MEHFVIVVNGCKPLTIITKHSILDAKAVLDRPLVFSKKVPILKPDNNKNCYIS